MKTICKAPLHSLLPTLLSFATLLTSCAVTLPETVGVEIPQSYIFAPTDEYSAAFADQSATFAEERWWELFGDTTLNRLITTALANNRNVAVAASRVMQAREQLSIARAEQLPTIDASISAGATYPQSGTPHTIGQSYSIGGTLSWELPLFGSMRLSREAEWNSYLSTEWGYRATMLALTAQVATTYFEWLQYARSLEIVRRSYALRLEAQQKIDSLHTYGFSSGVDLEQARTLTATAAADIPSYERSEIQTNLALNILLGEPPHLLPTATYNIQLPVELSPESEPLPAGLQGPTLLPASIPAGLPSDLLEQRPDVMEAWHAMATAAANAGLAHVARFPTIPLTASGGVASSALRNLFRGNPFDWSATLSLTEPILGYGRLRRAERIAIEDYRQSALSYEQTFLSALSEVENALVAIRTYRDQTARYAAIVESYRRISDKVSRLYFDGLADYLNVIDAERNLYSSQLQYIQLLTNQLNAYVDLYRAIGGK